MSEFEPYNFFGGVITGVIIVAFMVMIIMNQWNFSGTRKQNTYPQCCLHPKYHLKTIFLDDEKSRISKQIEGRMKLENPFTMFPAERLEEEFPIWIPTLSEQDILENQIFLDNHKRIDIRKAQIFLDNHNQICKDKDENIYLGITKLFELE